MFNIIISFSKQNKKSLSERKRRNKLLKNKNIRNIITSRSTLFFPYIIFLILKIITQNKFAKNGLLFFGIL